MSKLPLLLAAIALWLIAQQFDTLSRVFAMPGSNKYEQREIQGWKVMISPNVVADKVIYQPAVDQLTEDLSRIAEVVPENSISYLQGTVIWLEQGMPIPQLDRLFFNGGKALTKQHGLVPESYGGVISGNTKGYLAVAGIKPWQMLRELTHAYHQFDLRHSYAPIQSAYQNAMDKKLFHPESDSRIRDRAYAAKNQKEYLSELTVIYFGSKNVYPHNRKELAEHDPTGYCAVVKAWRLQGKQPGEPPLLCSAT